MNDRPFYDKLENELFLNGGFTYDPHFGLLTDSPESREHFKRYIVGIRKLATLTCDITDRHLRDWINEANRESLYLGAWLDESTGIRHWDFVLDFEHIDIARIAAKNNNELAIYDSHTGESLPVPSSALPDPIALSRNKA